MGFRLQKNPGYDTEMDEMTPEEFNDYPLAV